LHLWKRRTVNRQVVSVRHHPKIDSSEFAFIQTDEKNGFYSALIEGKGSLGGLGHVTLKDLGPLPEGYIFVYNGVPFLTTTTNLETAYKIGVRIRKDAAKGMHFC
jgi:hypothetical protein